MNLRSPATLVDRLALALAGGFIGFVLGLVLAFVIPIVSAYHAPFAPNVVWYTTAYVALVCFILGPVAADVVAMLVAAATYLFLGALESPEGPTYDSNPFKKPWHWVLLGLFVIGLVAVTVHALRS